MKRAMLIIGAWAALLAGTTEASAATRICFPPAFSARVGDYGPDWYGIFQWDMYVDAGVKQARFDVIRLNARYYFDYAHGAVYEYRTDTGSCSRYFLSGDPVYCVSLNAELVAAENVAGQSAERWCERDQSGRCSLTMYTVTERGVRIPRIVRNAVDPSAGEHFISVYTDVAVHEHGLPVSTFKLPQSCASLP